MFEILHTTSSFGQKEDYLYNQFSVSSKAVRNPLQATYAQIIARLLTGHTFDLHEKPEFTGNYSDPMRALDPQYRINWNDMMEDTSTSQTQLMFNLFSYIGLDKATERKNIVVLEHSHEPLDITIFTAALTSAIGVYSFRKPSINNAFSYVMGDLYKYDSIAFDKVFRPQTYLDQVSLKGKN